MIRRVALLLSLIATSLVAGSTLSGTGEVEASADAEVPRRVLDTRRGIGAPVAKLQRNGVLKLTIPGVAVSGDTAVLLNLTADQAGAPGYVSAWSCADSKPKTAILNYVPGRSVPNMAAIRYTSAGICLSTTSAVHLIADLTGVTTQGDLRGIKPNRIVDTRNSSPYQGGRDYRVRIAGTTGIPPSAAGAALNIAVVAPSSAGNLLVKPCGSSSNASTMNYLPGEVVAHFTFTGLSGDDVCIRSTATVDVVVDSFGWMAANSALRPITPNRLLDTRSGKGGTRGAVRNGQTVKLRVAGEGGVPNSADAVTVNLAAVNGYNVGHVTAYPCNASVPLAASLNLWPGILRANQATLKLSPAGEICLRTTIADSSSVNLIVDAVGYVEGGIVRQPPPVTTPPTTGKFVTLPPGSALPSGATCASRVRSAAEVRPENAAANSNRGGRQFANTDSEPRFNRIDGDFAGTTDEIIQWAACKWGINEDIVRSQVVKESWWEQSANGDAGESWGLGQVRDTYHQSAFQYSQVNARNSSAYNLDYTYAFWRACFEGDFDWLNTVERGAQYGPGDAWGCTGVWFSGRWYTGPAISYIEGGDTNGYGETGVKEHYRSRTWETSSFINN